MEGYLRKKLGASSLPASGGAPWVSATYCQSPEIPALLAAGKLRRQAGLILGNAVELTDPRYDPSGACTKPTHYRAPRVSIEAEGRQRPAQFPSVLSQVLFVILLRLAVIPIPQSPFDFAYGPEPVEGREKNLLVGVAKADSSSSR